MSKLIRQVYVPQASWARRLAFFALLVLLLSALGHRFGHIETLPFLWLLAAAAALALIALGLAAIALRTVWIEGDLGAGSAMAGLFMALLALAPFGYSTVNLVAHPPMSDVTTDPSNPPDLLAARRERGPQMNAVLPAVPASFAAQGDAYADLRPRRFEMAPLDLRGIVLRAADARGWRLLSEQRGGDGGTTLEFVAYSYLLGFPSDVAVRLTPIGEGTLVDLRSASRFGGRDFGENADRIRNFLAALDAAIEAMMAPAAE